VFETFVSLTCVRLRNDGTCLATSCKYTNMSIF